MQQAANEDTIAPEPVETLTLQLGARRIERSNEQAKPDELWLGQGVSPAGQAVPVYFRIAPPRPVVAELVFAVIARSVGLPVPRPYLVSVSPAALPKSPLAKEQGPHLTFGCENMPSMTFAQLLTNSPAALGLLRAWPDAINTAAIDEWLLNMDRNGGNLLYSNRGFWLIDHAEAFGGTQSDLWGLEEAIPSPCSPNMLLELLCQGVDLKARGKLLASVQGWMKQWADTVQQGLSGWLDAAGLKSVNSPFPANQMINFIQRRLATLEADLCQKLTGQNHIQQHSLPR